MDSMGAALLRLCLMLLVSPALIHATVHYVGDTSGWSLNTNLSAWASSQTFAIGDTLVFNYEVLHRVEVVNVDDFNICNTGTPLMAYYGGQTTVTLDKPGFMYFICPTLGHCQFGMRMAINVVTPDDDNNLPIPAPPCSPEDSTPIGTNPNWNNGGFVTNGGASGKSSLALLLGFSLIATVVFAVYGLR